MFSVAQQITCTVAAVNVAVPAKFDFLFRLLQFKGLEMESLDT